MLTPRSKLPSREALSRIPASLYVLDRPRTLAYTRITTWRWWVGGWRLRFSSIASLRRLAVFFPPSRPCFTSSSLNCVRNEPCSTCCAALVDLLVRSRHRLGAQRKRVGPAAHVSVNTVQRLWMRVSLTLSRFKSVYLAWSSLFVSRIDLLAAFLSSSSDSTS